MDRVLNIKNGDIVYYKINKGSNASKHLPPCTIENIDSWIKEDIVISVNKKYVTVGDKNNKFCQIKFNVEDDYNEKHTYGGADYKLYQSKQDIIDEIEYENLYSHIRKLFEEFTPNKEVLTLDKLRKINEVIK